MNLEEAKKRHVEFLTGQLVSHVKIVKSYFVDDEEDGCFYHDVIDQESTLNHTVSTLENAKGIEVISVITAASDPEALFKKQGGVFTDFIKHITNPDHVWNHEKYVGSRNLSGSEAGMESSVRFQYCHGNAFAEGYVGNLKFRIYYSQLQGFQVYVKHLNADLPVQDAVSRPVTFHPDGSGISNTYNPNKLDIIQWVVNHFHNRKV